MNSVVIVPDTNIIAINRGTADNLDNSIIYRDKDCKLHKIDLKSCAENFQAKNTLYSGNYVGERKIDNYFFLLYTSGMKTKIVFKSFYVLNTFKNHLLSGSKASRFHQLQELINEKNTQSMIYRNQAGGCYESSRSKTGMV